MCCAVCHLQPTHPGSHRFPPVTRRGRFAFWRGLCSTVKGMVSCRSIGIVWGALEAEDEDKEKETSYRCRCKV